MKEKKKARQEWNRDKKKETKWSVKKLKGDVKNWNQQSKG